MCYICQQLAGNSHAPVSSLFGGGSISSYNPGKTAGGLFGGLLQTDDELAVNGGGSLPGTRAQGVDGILLGVRYGGASGVGTGTNVRYDFTRPIDGSSPFNAAAKQVTIEWMQKWSNIANINFQNVTSGDFEISYGMKNLSTGSGVKGYAALSYYGAKLNSGPIVLDDDSPDLQITHFQYSAIGHEIGHALGLAHSFGSSTTSSTVGANKNNTDYSIMSYSGGPYSSSPNRVVETPMWGDVMAIRYLYGKNTSYHSGNDVFTPDHTRPMTIVDGNGIDTLLASNATGNTKIDLRFDWGSTSDDRVNVIPISGGNAKFWFADQFENAISGSGNDNITGNDAQNYLFGGEGNDQIFGLNGNDALFGGKEQNDVNERGNDTLDGGAGDDIIFGNGGNDTLAGGAGNDTLFGGVGNDILYGNEGVDRLYRGPGQDSLYGGLGNDSYYIGGNDGSATIIYQFEGKGVAGGDKLIVLANANGSGVNNAADVIAKMITDPTGQHTWINGLNVLIANALPNQFGADDISVVTGF